MYNVKIATEIKDGNKYIGTHNGTFHCDEVLAISLLKILPEFKEHEIIRTRNMDILNKCDIVVDVGGLYIPENKRFDHHQKGFCETFPFFKTKLSSAGLIYLHYGKDIIQELSDKHIREDQLDIIYKKVYKNFIEHIDANDNGIEICSEKLKYNISTSLPSRIAQLNPQWNEEQSNDKIMKQFQIGMNITREEFINNVLNLDSWLYAKDIVYEAMTMDNDYGGEIIVLNKWCPWKSHLFNIEKELNVEQQVKFVIYEDITSKTWRVQAVNGNNGRFSLRVKLPEKWCGLSNEELSEIADIPDCIFCHNNGFIAGNKTREGVCNMALKALVENDILLKKEKELLKKTQLYINIAKVCTLLPTVVFSAILYRIIKRR